MSIDDINRVVEIDRLSFSLPWSERTYRLELNENPAAHLFVAERNHDHGGEIVGYLGFWFIVDEAHISTFAVHPRERRAGIGSILLTNALEVASSLGAILVSLEVRVSNLAAISLYKGFGFEITGRRDNYYQDNYEDAFVMTLHHISEGINAKSAIRE